MGLRRSTRLNVILGERHRHHKAQPWQPPRWPPRQSSTTRFMAPPPRPEPCHSMLNASPMRCQAKPKPRIREHHALSSLL
ncbi:hypothetical protein ACFX1R_033444 [Malus domestica]